MRLLGKGLVLVVVGAAVAVALGWRPLGEGLPSLRGLPGLGDAAPQGALPRGSTAAHRCDPPATQSDSAPIYSTEPCPAGWSTRTLAGGTVSVLPAPRAPAASEPALRKLNPAGPSLQEQAPEKATNP